MCNFFLSEDRAVVRGIPPSWISPTTASLFSSRIRSFLSSVPTYISGLDGVWPAAMLYPRQHTTSRRFLIEQLLRFLWKNDIDFAPVVCGRRAFVGPVPRVIQIVRHL